jgi:hypothetical protein
LNITLSHFQPSPSDTKYFTNIGFEVLTAVVKKNSTFCHITPCSPLKVSRRFGGTCRLNRKGKKISQSRNQREIRCKHLCLAPMDVTFSSETSDDFKRTTRRNIAEDRTPYFTNFSPNIIPIFTTNTLAEVITLLTCIGKCWVQMSGRDSDYPD